MQQLQMFKIKFKQWRVIRVIALIKGMLPCKPLEFKHWIRRCAAFRYGQWPSCWPCSSKQHRSFREVCECRVRNMWTLTERPEPQPAGPLVQNNHCFEMHFSVFSLSPNYISVSASLILHFLRSKSRPLTLLALLCIRPLSSTHVLSRQGQRG